jgi:hypothetical protein
MLIVNTTYQVSKLKEEDWKKWVKSEYIPDVTKTGLLIHPHFYSLLVETEPDTKSYALQFEVKDLDTLEEWFQKYGTEMQKTMSDQFQEQVLGFTTLMEAEDLQ